jgi:hypothetical protein
MKERLVKYTIDMGSCYVDAEKRWEYNTTSDSLAVFTKTPEYYDFGTTYKAKESREFFGQSDALGMLELLIDWAETYEGEGTVENLIKKRIIIGDGNED